MIFLNTVFLNILSFVIFNKVQSFYIQHENIENAKRFKSTSFKINNKN